MKKGGRPAVREPGSHCWRVVVMRIARCAIKAWRCSDRSELPYNLSTCRGEAALVILRFYIGHLLPVPIDWPADSSEIATCAIPTSVSRRSGALVNITVVPYWRPFR